MPLTELKLCDKLASASAPQVKGKAFNLECKVETDQRDAVILAQGGLVGYALHIRAGHVVFAVRQSADRLTEIASRDEVKGAFGVSVGLAADGTMTLLIAGQETVTGKTQGLFPRQPAEDFCLGGDNGKPVGIYAPLTPLRGAVTELSFTSR